MIYSSLCFAVTLSSSIQLWKFRSARPELSEKLQVGARGAAALLGRGWRKLESGWEYRMKVAAHVLSLSGE